MNIKAKRSIYNIISGIISQAITIMLGILIPRLMIVNLGSESNGLVASITQILNYLVLFETGVGGATLQALYRPVSLFDKNEISSILSATNKYYKKTGIFYFVSLVLIATIYPVVVESAFPFSTVFFVIILLLLNLILLSFFV